MSVAFPTTASDFSTVASTATIILNKPANTADGDVLIAVISNRSGLVTTAPGGWTKLVEFSSNGDWAVYVLSVPTASSLASSWEWDVATARATGILFRVTGCNVTSPISQTGTPITAGSDNGANPVPMTIPGVTAQGGFVAMAGTYWAETVPTADLVPGASLIATATTPSAGAGRSALGVYGGVATGATGDITINSDWAVSGQDGVLIGLQSLAAPASPNVLMATGLL